MIRRVIFAGTPDFAAAALNAIAQAGFDIPLVLTQPDRPKGRGLQLQESPVKQAAKALGLTIRQPEDLKNSDIQTLLREQNADVMVVAAYGLLLPQAVLDIPRYGCLNIHASLLPRWRGAAPIQRAIEAGDTETGICIMQMDAGLDTGAIISRHVCPIGEHDTAQTLHDTLMTLGAQAIVADLQHYSERQAHAQAPEGITYAAKIHPSQAQIDWHRPAIELARQIRAFHPTPVARTTFRGQMLKIWAAQTTNGTGTAGSILASDKNGITVACGQGALLLTEVQAAGGKRMSAAAFATGQHIASGGLFGTES